MQGALIPFIALIAFIWGKNPEALAMQILFTCTLLLLNVQIILILYQVETSKVTHRASWLRLRYT